MLSLDPAFTNSFSASEIAASEKSMGEGSRSCQQGAFTQAIGSWTEAARFYERVRKPNKRSEVLTYLAQAYQSLDQSKQAWKNFALAQAPVEKSNDRKRIASALGSLGNVDIATRLAETAHRCVHEGLGTARRVGDCAVDAEIVSPLGNLLLINNWL